MVTFVNESGQSPDCLAAFAKAVETYAQFVSDANAEVVWPFATVAETAAYLEDLPQSDDPGNQCHGEACNPFCRPRQRQRLLPPDPNCWERAFAVALTAEISGESVTVVDGFRHFQDGKVHRHCWVIGPNGIEIELYKGVM